MEAKNYTHLNQSDSTYFTDTFGSIAHPPRAPSPQTRPHKKQCKHFIRFVKKIRTQVHRLAARHEYPFRLTNRPKRIGFQTSHPLAWPKEARDTGLQKSAHPPRERALKMRMIHAKFIQKARRGETARPRTYLPEEWHVGATIG